VSDFDGRLETIFREYRAATPDPEASAEFMPRLWERIESRRRYTWSLRRWAGGFVTAAAAICMLMAAILVWPSTTNRSVYTSTYLDALGDDMEIAYLVDASDVSQEGGSQR
jgi:hypothetical protein